MITLGTPQRRRTPLRIGRVISVSFLSILAVIWLLPVYLLVVNAITDSSENTGQVRLLPGTFGFFNNLAIAWNGTDFPSTFRNSLIYATVCSIVAVFVATMAAYAIVVLKLKRPGLWFWLIYCGALLPLQVFAVPIYVTAAQTNLLDTRLGLGIVYVALAIPFSMFVVRNVLANMPPEIGEAATIDGTNWWQKFRHIYLPLSVPAMAAAFVFQFIAVWNDLFFGIIVTLTPEAQPVMTTLAGLNSMYSTVGANALLAIAIVASLPTIIVFLGFQPLFVSSLKTNV